MSDFLFDAPSDPSPLVAARLRLARAYNAASKAFDAGEAITLEMTRETIAAELALEEIEKAELEKRK